MQAQQDERVELVDRLIANARLSAKRGEPDTVIFAGELMKVLEQRKAELLATLNQPQPKAA